MATCEPPTNELDLTVAIPLSRRECGGILTPIATIAPHSDGMTTAP